MEKAKSFFLVCVGVFLLATAVQVLSPSAEAERLPPDVPDVSSGVAVFSNGDIFWRQSSYSYGLFGNLYDLTEATGSILGWYAGGATAAVFLMDNGDVWHGNLSNGNWSQYDPLDLPVSARPTDWSQLKSNFGK